MLATDTSVYLFILETRLCPFGQLVKFETKKGGKSLLSEARRTVCETSEPRWTSAPSSHGAWWKDTRACVHGWLCLCARVLCTHRGKRRTHSRTHAHTEPLPRFLLSLSLRVVLEYLRCVIRHWFASEPEGKKKYLTERYIKRGHSEFLTFFAQLLQNE